MYRADGRQCLYISSPERLLPSLSLSLCLSTPLLSLATASFYLVSPPTKLGETGWPVLVGKLTATLRHSDEFSGFSRDIFFVLLGVGGQIFTSWIMDTTEGWRICVTDHGVTRNRISVYYFTSWLGSTINEVDLTFLSLSRIHLPDQKPSSHYCKPTNEPSKCSQDHPISLSPFLPSITRPSFTLPPPPSSYLYYTSVGKSNRFSFQLNNCGIKVSVKEVSLWYQSIQLSFSPTIDFFYGRCAKLLFHSSQSVAENCDLYFFPGKMRGYGCCPGMLSLVFKEFKTGQWDEREGARKEGTIFGVYKKFVQSFPKNFDRFLIENKLKSNWKAICSSDNPYEKYMDVLYLIE